MNESNSPTSFEPGKPPHLAEESEKIQRLREKLKKQLNQVEQRVASYAFKNKKIVFQQGKDESSGL